MLATGHSLLDRAEHRGAQATAPAAATKAAAASMAEAVPAGEPAP